MAIPSHEANLTIVSTATYTVLITDVDVTMTGQTTSTVTLPSAAVAGLGHKVSIGNANSGTCTMALTGGDTILPAGATIATLVGKSFVSDGISKWGLSG